MSKQRRRDGERSRSQHALVRSMMGKVRRAFAHVERDADGGAAALIGPRWSEPSERWGARQPVAHVTSAVARGSWSERRVRSRRPKKA